MATRIDKVIPIAKGSMNISYDVICPHCEYYIDDYYDRKWWREHICMDEGPDDNWEVSCPKCKQDFEIDGFEH